VDTNRLLIETNYGLPRHAAKCLWQLSQIGTCTSRSNLHEEGHPIETQRLWRAKPESIDELLRPQQRQAQTDHRRACGKGTDNQIRGTMGQAEHNNKIQDFREREVGTVFTPWPLIIVLSSSVMLLS
jgi:hypothetical protein